MADKQINILLSLKDGISKAIESISKKFNGFTKQLESSKFIFAGVTASVGLVTRAIIDITSKFQSAFTGVRKTVDATEAEFQVLENQFKKLSTTMPQSFEALSAVGEAAGQLGIEKGNILEFTKVMANLGVTTNLSADEAATQLARFANITQMSQKDFERLGSTIVSLGNNLATTEAEITSMSLRLAAAGKQIGLSEAETVSMAAALSSLGLEAEAGGTAFSRVMIEMVKSVESGDENLKRFADTAGLSITDFTKLFRENGIGALQAFMDGVGRMGPKSAILFDELKLDGIRVADAMRRVANSGTLMSDAINLGTKAWKENNALSREAELRYGTFESQYKMLQNSVAILAESFGKLLLPALKTVVFNIKNVVMWISELSPAMKKTIIVVTGLVGAFSAVFFGAGAIVAIAPQLAAAWAVMTGPIGLLTLAITGIVGAITYFSTSNSDLAQTVRATWDTIGTIFNEYTKAIINSIQSVKSVFSDFGMMLKAVATKDFGLLKESFNDIRKHTNSIGDGFVKATDTIKAELGKQLLAQKESADKARRIEEEKQKAGLAGLTEKSEKEAQVHAETIERKNLLDEENLARTQALQSIALEVKRNFEEQQTAFEKMGAAERIKLLKDTLGERKVAKAAAEIQELETSGKHKEAMALQDKLYFELFNKLNSDAVKDANAQWRKHWEAQATMAVLGTQLNKKQYEALGTAFSDVMTIMGEESLAAFRVMQGVAIVDTIVKTYESAQNAFASLSAIPIIGVPLGLAAAGAAITAGFFRVNKIREQKPPALEYGGIIQRDSVYRAGEYGKEEGVIPLEGRGLTKLQNALGTGGGTQIINLQLEGQTLQTWIRKVEEKKSQMSDQGIL